MHAYIYICQLRIMKRVIGHPNISYICGVSGPWRLANQAIHRTFGFWDVPWMDDEMGLGWWWWGGAPGAPQKTSCYPHQKRFGGNLLLDVVKDWLVQGRWNTWIHKIIQWVFFYIGSLDSVAATVICVISSWRFQNGTCFSDLILEIRSIKQNESSSVVWHSLF